MKLKDYTTEELRAELKRRAAIKKAERNAIPRCRMCSHFGEITYFGEPVTDENRWMGYTSCCYHKTKNNKYYRTHSPSQLACEHFEKKSWLI